MYRHTQAYHCIFYHDSYQLKSIRIITGWGKAGSDGDQGRFEELDASSVSDVNHLEKQLICELKGTQLEAKTMRKIAVKFVIISLSCACPKYRNWSLSFAFQSDLTHFAGRWMFACRLAIGLARCRCCMPLDRGSTDLESQCCPTRDLSDTTGNSHTPVGDSEKHQGSAPPGSKAKGEFDKDGQASHRQGFPQPPGRDSWRQARRWHPLSELISTEGNSHDRSNIQLRKQPSILLYSTEKTQERRPKGSSLLGDLQKQPGHGPGHPCTGCPCWSRGQTRWPPVVPFHLSHPVSQWFHSLVSPILLAIMYIQMKTYW